MKAAAAFVFLLALVAAIWALSHFDGEGDAPSCAVGSVEAQFTPCKVCR